MIPRMGTLVAGALLAALAGCDGCRNCGAPAGLAVLRKVDGTPVDRDFAAKIGKWSTAAVGARFLLGDGIRVGPQARATLRLADGSQVRLRPGSEVRFMDSKGEGHRAGLDVRVGEAEISVGDADLQFATPLGVATLSAGSRVTLGRATTERISLRVELGFATLQSESGEVREFRPGQSVEIGIGIAMFEPIAPAPEPKPIADAPIVPAVAGDSGANAVVEATGDTPAVEPGARSVPLGPTRASVHGLLGESFSVHAARLPLVVGFMVGDRCKGESVLIVDGKRRTRSTAQASALLAGGVHPYELRCLAPDGSEGERVDGGTVRVLRDPGTASFPVRAATSSIDTDGKRYTVLYQNLLPRISLRWPAAPVSTGYTLSVESQGASTKHTEHAVKQARFSFAPGALREGKHTLRFTSADGKQSKPTTLELRFDNAAPRASVSEPKDKSFLPGQNVKIAGVALRGSKVSVNGAELLSDSQARFSGTVTPSAAFPDIALRIESPHGGTHYYIRHAAAGAAQ